MISLRENNHCIIVVGSVDGICTAAAFMRLLNQSGNSSVQVLFIQPSAVLKFDISVLKPESLVTFVNLAVDTKDENITLNFVQSILNGGHTIFAIIDEHDAEVWNYVIGKTSIEFDMLEFKPETGRNINLNSSGAVLLSSISGFEHPADSHVVRLCEAADAENQNDSSLTINSMVNQAMKSRTTDDERKKYLVYYLATGNSVPDEIIAGWISEYDDILVTHERLKKTAVYVTKGIVRIDASGQIIDPTILLSDLFTMGARVAMIHNDIFNQDRGYKFPKLTIATSDKSLDILKLVKAKVPNASGFSHRANIDPEHEAVAIDAVLEGMI